MKLMMLDYIDGKMSCGSWMMTGADALLHSTASIPADAGRLFARLRSDAVHPRFAAEGACIEFLRSLPILLDTPVLFVHTGIDPARSIDNRRTTISSSSGTASSKAICLRS